MIEITIVNQGSELARVAGLLDRLGAEHHPAPEVVADMQLALDEVLTSISDYAYNSNAEHKIHICSQVLDNTLEAVIEDDGAPFDPLAISAPDIRAPLHALHVSGVGIHFVRNLMDEVTYDRVGERNRLVLRMRFKT